MFHHNLLATGEIKMKHFVLSDKKEGKMSGLSLKLQRQVSISATYSQRLLERFGTLRTWATVNLHLQVSASQFHFVC